VWDVGKIVKIDSKWRILIPKDFRDDFKPGEEVIIEKGGKGLLIIRKKPRNAKEILDKIKEIKLEGDPNRIFDDAAKVKDMYWGLE